MKELTSEHKYLVPMLKVMANRIATRVDWIMIARASMTGLMSILDIYTDIYMVYFFFRTGQDFYATFTLTSILICLFLQCMAIYFMYKHDTKAMKRELINALTFVKIGRAQFQVMKKSPNQGSQTDEVLEYIFFRCIELFSEAIPSTVLQGKKERKGITKILV
jgi:hypothetical protein